MKHSRRRQVLEHIMNHGGITRMYALVTFHVQNLAQVIMELRQMGWPIKNDYFKREDGVTTVEYYLTDKDLYMAEFENRLDYDADGRYVAVLPA